MARRSLALAMAWRKTMKFKPLGLAVLLTAFAGSAFAQNHISATEKCGKPDDSKQPDVHKTWPDSPAIGDGFARV